MKHKSRKLVAGVGINDADDVVVRFSKDIDGERNREWICPFYKTWAAMLNRCYRKSNDNKYYAYKDTTVCLEWHRFSNFKAWMEQQDWEGKELDKDLLTDNNQYSPNNCMFIPGWLNTFITGEKSNSDINLVGIYEKEGCYFLNKNTKRDWRSESFLDVKDAIYKYHNLRVECITSSDLSDYVKTLAIDFFDRRMSDHFDIVRKFPQRFINRGYPIRRKNLPKVGDKFKTVKGFHYTVKEVNNSEDIIIEFDDGMIYRTRNKCIKNGRIRKPCVEDKLPGIKIRIDKVFKWNSHGLISGIQTYSTNRYAVSFNNNDLKSCKCFKALEEALIFRHEILVARVKKIVGEETTCLKDALEYFNNRWQNEVVRYYGKSEIVAPYLS